MDLFENLLKQLAAVQDVWFPFLLAVGLVTALVWRAVDYAYSTRLTNAESTQGLLERQLQEYKDKLSGASPDEAKARLDALEERLNRLAPRQISAEQRDQMAKVLDPFRGALAEISQDMASAEAVPLARAITAAFNSAGWQVQTPMVMGIGNPPLSGIKLEVSDRASLTPHENAAAQALRTVGLEFDVETCPPHPASHGHPLPAVRILLTSRLQD
ncbi:MAG: hypothetical protein ACKO01_13300 [Erythrobacter sp.]